MLSDTLMIMEKNNLTVLGITSQNLSLRKVMK